MPSWERRQGYRGEKRKGSEVTLRTWEFGSLPRGGVTLLEAFFSITLAYGRWLSRWGGCYVANGGICASTSGWNQEHRVHTRQFNKET